jgi:hypothetical protein
MEFGISVDCSITPHISWENNPGFSLESKGTNYSDSPECAFAINHSNNSLSLREIPVTIRNFRRFSFEGGLTPRSLYANIKYLIVGNNFWLRPNGNNLSDMLTLVDYIEKQDNTDYLMFMLHSSELMPGGSPYFKDTEAIEKLYKDIEYLFNRISTSFKGITLKDYNQLISA